MMTLKAKKIAVTGGTGQIAYSLLFRLANGDLFGKNQPIDLHIYDLPEMESLLKAVQMELEDCSFPLLQNILVSSNLNVIFKDIDAAFLIGSKPRTLGMERSDLLLENGKIFIEQGKAINEGASKEVRILVVGNPCNTNCLIAMHHAPRIPKCHFSALMQLDYNRAKNLIAKKANVSSSQIKNLIIWGNHSSTQVPDFTHGKIEGKSHKEKTLDQQWLQKEFIESVQKRGASIIAARGKSSAASAANAAIEAMKNFYEPTPIDDWYTAAICTDQNPYGIEEDLIFGFPCKTDQNGNCQIIPHLEWDFFISEKIAITQKELIEERKAVSHLLHASIEGKK